MSVRTRDWLKFGALVAMAFVFGLAFSSALDLPKRGDAAERAEVVVQSGPLRQIPAAKPAADLGDAFAAVAEHVKPAVVFVKSERRERTTNRRLPPGFEDFFQIPRRPQVEQGTGSGFIVSQDGYILTNNHVVQGADRVTVRLLDNREFTARLVGTDPATDVAVIKIDARGLSTVSFGNSDSTRIGEWVLAIGNPLGEAFTFTVTAGIVSAKGRLLRGLLDQTSNYSIQDFLQTDAAINPGNSGGPLVNVHGEVIGINSAIASETGYYAGYGFAIPIKLAATVMEQLIRTGHVDRVVMGIGIRDARPADAKAVGLTEIRGVVVEDYTSDDSPAKRAGLLPGDVIVAVDGKPVDYVAQLQQRVAFKKPGEPVEVTVLREGSARHTYTVRLARAPTEVSDADDGKSGTGGSAENALGRSPAGATLGLTLEPITQEDASQQGLRQVVENGGGLVVMEVSADGPAYQSLSGARDSGGALDIILKVNGKPVRTRAEFRAAVAAVKHGDILTLQVLTRRSQELWSGRIVRIEMP
ncbi:MAG TPA: trypsin-like peptidase domain-containing protein [Gemmatimonadales bacterium]|jgi:serine protease Do